MKCSVSTQKKTLVRDLHAADVRYHLDCWLDVTKNTGLLVRCNCNNHFFYYILVWYKCNIQHRWLDIAIINMNADPVQVYQTCMLVEANLTDVTAS